MERFKSPKFVAALLVAAVALVVFLQNQDAVTLKVLWFAKVYTTVATALTSAFLVGLVTGALGFSHWKTKHARAKDASSSSSPT